MEWTLPMGMKLKKLNSYLLPILILIIAISAVSLRKRSSNDKSIFIELANKHRGVCWVGGPNKVDSSMIAVLSDNHVNWISQTPFGWQIGHSNPQIGTNIGNDRAWWGERDEGLRITTRLAKAKGISTILKPHIWLRDNEGKWRGEISMNSDNDWKKWFADYEEFILYYAQIAEEEKMEMLCIGTELHKTCVEREEDWRMLIKKIRAIYSGPLTYAANFSQEFEDITFWDDLDYIGVQAYFPLTDQENPTLKDVRQGWQPHLEKLKKFSKRFNKPILFTEAGYKSTKDSGIEPWTWPQRLGEEERENIYSEETQATLYEAMFREVFDQPYIAGIHLWKWYPSMKKRTQGRSSRQRSFYNIDFTPQGKAAEKVMTEWFSKFSQ